MSEFDATIAAMRARKAEDRRKVPTVWDRVARAVAWGEEIAEASRAASRRDVAYALPSALLVSRHDTADARR